jgi:hypothetical protein
MAVLEGGMSKLNDTFKGFQGGNIDQIPVGGAGAYTILLNGSGSFVVFLLPYAWLNTGEVSLDTLSPWTTIGIVSAMWQESASAIHLSVSASRPLRMYTAEFADDLRVVHTDDVDTATSFSLSPGSMTMFYLIFLEDTVGGGPASVHLSMAATPPGPPLTGALILIAVAAMVVVGAVLVLRRFTRGSA